jgi:glucose-6-phosphate-specific signal transduction histidine kinase
MEGKIMKKTIIGSVFMITGMIITLSLIITASLYVPTITEWRGTKLWFVIFGSKCMGSSVQSLCCGTPFVIGMILFITGFIILVVEYFNKENSKIKK